MKKRTIKTKFKKEDFELLEDIAAQIGYASTGDYVAALAVCSVIERLESLVVENCDMEGIDFHKGKDFDKCMDPDYGDDLPF